MVVTVAVMIVTTSLMAKAMVMVMERVQTRFVTSR